MALDLIPNDVPIQLNSSNLGWISYNKESQELTVGFRNGSVYKYTSVPDSVVSDLLYSSSKGSYFHHNIRWSFSFNKV